MLNTRNPSRYGKTQSHPYNTQLQLKKEDQVYRTNSQIVMNAKLHIHTEQVAMFHDMNFVNSTTKAPACAVQDPPQQRTARHLANNDSNNIISCTVWLINLLDDYHSIEIVDIVNYHTELSIVKMSFAL